MVESDLIQFAKHAIGRCLSQNDMLAQFEIFYYHYMRIPK